MSVVPAAAPRFLGLTPAWAAILLIAVSTLLRFYYATWLPLLPDEAYYFQWSQHLDASYFSKGPGVAYTIAASAALFGENNLGVRFFAVALSAGTAWQVFLLARRWYDDVVALIAVLVVGVVPLYAVGAVLMTIDPLSAFFWVWAANLFSGAIAKGRYLDWVLTGFAVGSGFLAKYLNAMELVAFIAFLLLLPQRRHLLLKPHFWIMLLTTLVCTLPVWWWNHQHGWASVSQLENRGHLDGPLDIHPSTFLDFLGLQSVVLSPLLFLALLIAAGINITRLFKKPLSSAVEGDLLLLLLFLSVFLFYAGLSWHLRGEPNWPAISYLSLIILLAAQWRQRLVAKLNPAFMVTVFCLAWLQTLLLQDTQLLSLPQRMDPLGRAVGWSEIATHLDQLRRDQNADVLIADAYKEASIFSFHLPDHRFIYTVGHFPPVNQYDFWPGYPKDTRCALWITAPDSSPDRLKADFNSITPIEGVVVSFRGKPFREYTIYRCETR